MAFLAITPKYICSSNWPLTAASSKKSGKGTTVRKAWLLSTFDKWQGQSGTSTVTTSSIETSNLKISSTPLVSSNFVILAGQPTLLSSNLYTIQSAPNFLRHTWLCTSWNRDWRFLRWKGWPVVFRCSLLLAHHRPGSFWEQSWREWDLWQDFKGGYSVSIVSEWSGSWFYWEDFE